MRQNCQNGNLSWCYTFTRHLCFFFVFLSTRHRLYFLSLAGCKQACSATWLSLLCETGLCRLLFRNSQPVGSHQWSNWRAVKRHLDRARVEDDSLCECISRRGVCVCGGGGVGGGIKNPQQWSRGEVHVADGPFQRLCPGRTHGMSYFAPGAQISNPNLAPLLKNVACTRKCSWTIRLVTSNKFKRSVTKKRGPHIY